MARRQRASLGERVRQKRLAREIAPSEPVPGSLAPSSEPTSSLRDRDPEPASVASGPTLTEPPRSAEPPGEGLREDELALVLGPPRSRWALGAALAALVIGVAALGISRGRPRSPASAPSALAKVVEPPRATPTVAPPPPPPASPEPSASPSAPPSASASASAARPDATSLRDHALALLQEAKNPEAMAAARAALDADPTDAMPYLVLGSALQDTGKWPEAHQTYELCVKVATKGMLDECRAMLRRK